METILRFPNWEATNGGIRLIPLFAGLGVFTRCAYILTRFLVLLF